MRDDPLARFQMPKRVGLRNLLQRQEEWECDRQHNHDRGKDFERFPVHGRGIVANLSPYFQPDSGASAPLPARATRPAR